MGQGVRKLSIKDQLPDCEIYINKNVYNLKELSKGKNVVDIGCGDGATRKIVEGGGGVWTGVEPFEGGGSTVIGDIQNLPLEDNTFDVVVTLGVLHLAQDMNKAFSEVSRILKPGGLFVGHVPFIEAFHEISFAHPSHKALELYCNNNSMKLEKLGAAINFAIAVNLSILLHPIPSGYLKKFLNVFFRSFLKMKSKFAYIGLRLKGKNRKESNELSNQYFTIECLRQSNAFQFVIRKTKTV